MKTPPTTTAIYTLSLHDALPISPAARRQRQQAGERGARERRLVVVDQATKLRSRGPSRERGEAARSEEHTSELQSQFHLVCRLLLEKKKLTVAILSIECIAWK